MKILLVRFSSFGDVTQCLSVPAALRRRFPEAEVHWVTRSDLAPLLHGHPDIAKIWAYDRRTKFAGLRSMIEELRRENFDRVYDAHNNLRSRYICFRLARPTLRRSIRRWKRFLLFNFRINKFEQPFSGQRDLLEPLAAWGIPARPSPPAPQLYVEAGAREKAQALLGDFGPFIACAPSAAHALKRWPQAYWKKLLAAESDLRFVLLGGPEDLFLADIAAVAPERILNLAGRSDLATSAAVVELSQGLITNDTGLLHVAEQLGKTRDRVDGASSLRLSFARHHHDFAAAAVVPALQ